MEPRSTWLTLLLLTLQTARTASNRVQNPSQKRLNRILGGSVLLPADIPSADRVARIEWDFQGGNGSKFVLAEFCNGKVERLNPRDRFGQRLEITNETTLRIKDLEIMDSGKYTIKVRFASARYQDDTLDIAVYEPVPEPQILPQYLSNSPDGCNVTLQCLVLGKGGFNISWKRGDPLRDLEDGSDWYHLSGNGTDLHVFWQLNSPEPNLTCLVTNPVDQKTIPVNLLNICQTEIFAGQHEARLHWEWIRLIIFFVILVLLTAFGIQTWKTPNRSRKRFV